MTTPVPPCPEPEVLVEDAIDQILTQYRESPNLIGLARGFLNEPASTAQIICQILDHFDIETATDDQLTIIGKWLGWPRCHCAGRLRPVFGFPCDPLDVAIIVDSDGSIVVDCPPIEVDPIVVSAFPVVVAPLNEEYQAFIVTASGGLPPYTFSIALGPLPDGITLGVDVEGESAIVSGTPTGIVAEYGPIIIRVTDSIGTRSTRSRRSMAGSISATATTPCTSDR